MPYLAPEILQGPYAAEPADIWSCGIVFVAMLAGGSMSFNRNFSFNLKQLQNGNYMK